MAVPKSPKKSYNKRKLVQKALRVTSAPLPHISRLFTLKMFAKRKIYTAKAIFRAARVSL
jgi:hypothetical protein